jgi:hypothetical protein
LFSEEQKSLLFIFFLCSPSEDSLQRSAVPDGSPSQDSSPLWAGEIAGFEPRTAVLQPGVATNEPPLLPKFSQISLSPLAVVFNCFSKAEWEQQIDFLKLHGSYKRLF